MAKGTAQDDLFRSKAPLIMALLIRDFKLDIDGAAAILGNLGHESAGFSAMQEIKPTVPGSRGGFGWAQWTGPRRRAFEAYCQRNDLDPVSDKANYGWLFSELKGTHRKAIEAVANARGLAAKVKAFEKVYENAGVKHYESRNQWAAIAIDAWHAASGASTYPDWVLPPAGKPASAQKPAPAGSDPAAPAKPALVPAPVVVEKPVVADPGELEKHPLKSKTVWQWIITSLIVPIMTVFSDWRVQLAIVAIVAAFALYAIKRRVDLYNAVRRLMDGNA